MSTISFLLQDEQVSPPVFPKTAFELFREQVLGKKLIRAEELLWKRLHRYVSELVRLEDSTTDDWRPRVMFVPAVGWSRRTEHADPSEVAHIPFDRKKWAVTKARSKVQAVDERLARIQGMFHARRHEIHALRSQRDLLRAFLAPKRRPRRKGAPR